MVLATIFWIILILIIISSIRIVKQYQRGVKFTLGKFSSVMEPGLRIVIPLIQTYERVDVRTKAIDVPSQDAITKDNVSVKVNAVLYYKVADAKMAVLEVEKYYYAVSQYAQTTMRDVVGENELDNLLSKRDSISKRIKEIVDKATDPWGIKVIGVELKDVELPDEMKRVIAKEAESERERRAVIIRADGEVKASDNIAKAAKKLSGSPGALHLRTLQTLNDISSDESNTLVFVTPIEVLRAFEKMGKKK